MPSKEKKVTIEVDQLTIWRFATAVFAILFIVSWITGGFGSDGTAGSGTGTAPRPAAAPSPTPTAPAPAPSAANVKNLDLSDNYFQGDENAPVTIVEFSDFQCPFCSRFYSQTKSQIDENYVKTGKVKFVYADFPLESIHPQAMPAALAGRCAGEQDNFWEFHDLAFENQQSLSDASYKQWASDLGLDTNQFNTCLDSKKYESAIRDDIQEGSANGIRGTPGFIINDRLVSGAQPFSAFQAAIDAALAS